MPFQYKKVLVIGATSGIGEALATRLVKEGSSIVAVGRRKEKLEQLVQTLGKDKVSTVAFDITDFDNIANFAAHVTKTHEDLDCIMLNSGIQRGLDFTKPETVDLDVIKTEFETNYLSYVALTKAFLPFLQKKQTETALIYTSSTLALVPMTRCFNYCASKAALHHMLLVLREQLRDSKIKIVEIFPPAVQTELHDEDKQPDIKNGRELGMPLKQFTEEAYQGLAEGRDEVFVGESQKWHDHFEARRREDFEAAAKKMRGGK